MANSRVGDKPSAKLGMSSRAFGLFARDKTTQTEIRAVSTQRVSGPHEAPGYSTLPFQFICCCSSWDFRMASREQA